jgi:hypothetical protein
VSPRGGGGGEAARGREEEEQEEAGGRGEAALRYLSGTQFTGALLVLYWYKSTNTDAKGAAGVKSEEGHLKRDLTLNSDIARDPSQVLNTDLHTDLNSDLNRDLSDIEGVLDLQHEVFEGVVAGSEAQLEQAKADAPRERESARERESESEREKERESERAEAGALQRGADGVDEARDVEPASEEAEASEGYALEVRQCVYFCTSKASKARRLQISEGEPAGYALEVRQCVYFCTSKAIRGASVCEGEPRRPRDTH